MGGLHTGRRHFIGGLLAAGLLPQPTWADAGAPAYLSAAASQDGTYLLCGIGDDLDLRFRIPLPARGHAAAAHPTRPEAVAFARRPGTFALVIDCVSGQPKATLASSSGRHFYGHGVFSKTGDWLFTTENDFEAGQGRIGVWDVHAGYTRAGEFESGGIGPHDIKRLPGSETLIIANGGIDTHPETGRTKLNIATMQSNLACTTDGKLTQIAALPAEMQKNSIRHLAVSAAGDIAFGMQWQGDGPAAALVGQHRMGGPMILMDAHEVQLRQMDGYIGSIAYSHDEATIAATSPRGDQMHFYDATDQRLIRTTGIQDVCGVSPQNTGFLLTSGTGDLRRILPNGSVKRVSSDLRWDNHLIRI